MTSNQVTIASSDQSMWYSGDAKILDWEKYLPLIGGDLTEWEATGVVIVPDPGRAGPFDDGAIGEVALVDGEVIYTPGVLPLYTSSGFKQRSATVTLRIEMESRDDDGNLLDTTTRDVDVVVTQRVSKKNMWSKEKVEETTMLSEDAEVAVSTRDNAQAAQLKFDAVTDAEKLADPTSFTGDSPMEVLDIDFNLAETLTEIATEAVSGVTDFFGEIGGFITDLGEDIVNSTAVQKTKEFFVDTGKALQKGWDFAKDKVPALKKLEDGIDAVGNGIVNAAKSAYNAASDALTSAVEVVDDLLNLSKKVVSKAYDIIEDTWGFLTGWFKKTITKFRDEVRGLDKNEKNQLDDAKKEIKEHEKEQENAKKALDALNKFKDHLGDKDLGEEQRKAKQAEKEADAKLKELKAAFAGEGSEEVLGAIDDAARDVARAGAKKLEKGGGFFDDALDLISDLNPVQMVTNVIANSNLELLAKAVVEAKAQAGLKLSAKIDSGSVDSLLVYDVAQTMTVDEEGDSITFDIGAMFADTDLGPFSTESPNAQFAIEILYKLYGSIALDFDVSAKAAGEVLVDVPAGEDAFHWATVAEIDGSKTIVEFDTKDLEVELVPPPLQDILSLTVIWPTITTQGVHTEAGEYTDEYSGAPVDFATFVSQALDDPDAFDLDQLATRLLDLLKPKIGLAPGFEKLLDDAGAAVEDGGDLAGKLVGALKTVLGAIVDIELQKADGSDWTTNLPNPYKDGDGYLPIFTVTNENAGNDGLFHIDLIDNPTFTGDLDLLQELGFFTSSGRTQDTNGEDANFVNLSLDVDQLVAVVVAIAAGTPPLEAFNPLDLSLGLSDIFGGDDKKDDDGKSGDTSDQDNSDSLDDAAFDALEDNYKFDLSFEAADLDVHAGAYFSQSFGLAIEDMAFTLLVEEQEVATFNASDRGDAAFNTFTLENVSAIEDRDGNGQIDYRLELRPSAKFFNDTQLGLNFGYQLDLLKAKAEVLATVPSSILAGVLDFLELPSKISVEAGIGPLLRMQGELDLLSIDVFESMFDFDAGLGSIEGTLPEWGGADEGQLIYVGAGSGALAPLLAAGAYYEGSLYAEATGAGVQTWDEAVAFARADGSALLQIDSEGENAFVAALFAPTYDRPVWIGADDLAEEGVFLDLTGNPIAGGWTNWSEGEPNNWGGAESYVVMQDGGLWNDAAATSGWDSRTVIERDIATEARSVFGDGEREDATGSRFGDWIYGTDGVNVISARGGDDMIRGEGGDDTLLGGAGDDILAGGTGDDVLTGGTGADRFAFSGAFGTDRITDFSGDAGEGDVIDLRQIDLALEGDLRFANLLITQRGENARIEIDMNRDGVADGVDLDGDDEDDAVAIVLLATAAASLSAQDFML